MSTVYDCSEIDTRTAGLAAAKNALKAGRLVVLPTDTLYGLAADAFDSEAVTSLLRAKGRGRDMPVPFWSDPGTPSTDSSTACARRHAISFGHSGRAG